MRLAQTLGSGRGSGRGRSLAPGKSADRRPAVIIVPMRRRSRRRSGTFSEHAGTSRIATTAAAERLGTHAQWQCAPFPSLRASPPRRYDGFAVDIWSLGLCFMELICGPYSIEQRMGWLPAQPTEPHHILQGLQSLPDRWAQALEEMERTRVERAWEVWMACSYVSSLLYVLLEGCSASGWMLACGKSPLILAKASTSRNFGCPC